MRNPLHGMALRVELLRPEVNEGGERHLDKLRHDIKRLDEALEALLWYVLPGALNAIKAGFRVCPVQSAVVVVMVRRLFGRRS